MGLRRVLASAILVAGASLTFAAQAVDITGAGATFPYPIYAKWAEGYKKATGNNVNYQSIGSGGGIKQIKGRTVDFGASDMPLPQSELDKHGLVQFPAVMGGVVPIVNIPNIGPGQLRLTGDLLAAIYLGKITKWNDPAITAINPDLDLPAQDIAVVRRSDGSGTTYLWTEYLSKVNEEFKKRVGFATAVKWPVGIGGKGNEGVAAYVQRIKGAIGYVEYAFAKRAKMSHTQLINREGVFVQPTDDTFKAAANEADWSNTPGMGVLLTNQLGKDSWPISGASFILMNQAQQNAAKGQEVLNFFNWAFQNGSGMAMDLDYVALPDSVIEQVHDVWRSQVKDVSGKVLWQ